ncbi:MAG TPA: site-2 protease family protein [Acetobacteraceae bacterium]|nr:site-2 protease family protein [Acetobacteraceae bacterium]
MALVAAAGPAMSLSLASIGDVLLWLMAELLGLASGPATLCLRYFVLVNLALGLFNLLPIPPLDGSRIAAGSCRTAERASATSDDGAAELHTRDGDDARAPAREKPRSVYRI